MHRSPPSRGTWIRERARRGSHCYSSFRRGGRGRDATPRDDWHRDATHQRERHQDVRIRDAQSRLNAPYQYARRRATHCRDAQRYRGETRRDATSQDARNRGEGRDGASPVGDRWWLRVPRWVARRGRNPFAVGEVDVADVVDVGVYERTMKILGDEHRAG